jgi:hypothetical protein
MRVSGVSSYVQQIATVRPTQASRETTGTRATDKAPSVRQKQTLTPQSVLSQDEQQFFTQLFPDYALQERSGVQFNRQGQLQRAGGGVGLLFDGRA